METQFSESVKIVRTTKVIFRKFSLISRDTSNSVKESEWVGQDRTAAHETNTVLVL